MLAGDPPGKYAPAGVQHVMERLIALGGRRAHLRAVMIGGASMFSASSNLAVGMRNAAAVRDALGQAGVPIVAEATGGDRGRTLRVYVGDGRVTARVAGSSEEDLLASPSVGAPA